MFLNQSLVSLILRGGEVKGDAWLYGPLVFQDIPAVSVPVFGHSDDHIRIVM